MCVKLKMNSCAEESDYSSRSSSSNDVHESRKTTTTTEEELDSRNMSHGDALSILKHCDAATLEKLCGTLSNSTDSTVAYANFPKRSLVHFLLSLVSVSKVLLLGQVLFCKG